MSDDPKPQPPPNPSPWAVPERESPREALKSVVGGIILFIGGVIVGLMGVAMQNTLLIATGGAMVSLGLGWAALSGEKVAGEVTQGGAPARKARQEAPAVKERERPGHRDRERTAAGLAHDPRDDDPTVRRP